ncbi:hypothetical protein ABZ772_37025 [Streptomyces griseoincarnatus]
MLPFAAGALGSHHRYVRGQIDHGLKEAGYFVLALDQGMVAAALAQQLRPGLLQRPFRTGCFRARVRPLPAKERFSI